MNKWKKPTALISLVAMPHALAVLLGVNFIQNVEPYQVAPLIAQFCMLGACALLALVYAARRRDREGVSQLLLCAMLSISACIYPALVLMIRPMPQPTQFLSMAVMLSFLGAVSIAGLCFMLCLQRDALQKAEVKRTLGYTFWIPLGCALGFSIWQSTSPEVDILLSISVAILCLAVACMVRWIRSFFGKAPSEQAIEIVEPDGMAKKHKFHPHKSALFIAIFAIVLPIAGLSLNEVMGLIAGCSSPWFYIIALANGVLMLPAVRSKRLPLPLLYLQAVGFGYIIYFALIFLPLMPFGLLGLLALVGALILTPAIVFVIELLQMRDKCKALRVRYSARVLGAVLALGIFTLPAILFIDMGIDRQNYMQALAAIDQATPQASSSVDATRLSRTLTHMNEANLRFDRGDGDALLPFYLGRGPTSGGGNPLISSAYSAFVFGGQPLGSTRVRALYNTFYDEKSPHTKGVMKPDVSSWHIAQEGFELLSHQVRTEFDAANGVYRSWVSLEIKNTLHRDTREFDATFTIPQDCFITDYSLYVGSQNKRGLLSEERAAGMVYDSIVRRAKDPGLLTYANVNDLRLRVFPFAKGEVRKTGFEVMHIAPVTLSIEGQDILLDVPSATHQPIDMGAHSMRCMPATCKDILPSTDNAYDNAMILMHNVKIDGANLERVRDSFAEHVLTPVTAFIVLESAEQEATLRTLQERILSGEAIPERFVSMDEPSALLLLVLALGMLLILRRRQRRVRA